MHINESLKNFLFDLDNYITVYKGALYVFNYQKLIKITSTEVIIDIIDYKLIVKGKDLIIKKMTKQEIKINGVISSMEFNYA